MISVIEKESLLSNVERLTTSPEGAVFFKLVTNVIYRQSPILEKRLTEKGFSYQSEANIREVAPYVIDYLLEANESAEIFYTTGEIAKYFSVSIATVNNWINEGRFVGVIKAAGKQARIPNNALWKASNGKEYRISDIIQERLEDLKTLEINEDEEKRGLLQEISRLEEKYGGSFETTLKTKTNKSDSELSDAMYWKYLIKRVGND